MKEVEITAYALNELQKEDRDNFETGLAGDADLQSELHSVTRVADALEQIMVEPAEGLEAGAREQLLRTMTANQEALRARRKIVRFAVPVSLAAAASIAVLLWVAGGITPEGPAVAAADGAGVAEDPIPSPEALVSRGLSGEFKAKINSKEASFTFRGDGQSLSSADLANISSQSSKSEAPTIPYRVQGIRSTLLTGSPGRTISMSESARVAQELREDAGLSLTSPAVRMKPLIWDDDLSRWGSAGGQP